MREAVKQELYYSLKAKQKILLQKLIYHVMQENSKNGLKNLHLTDFTGFFGIYAFDNFHQIKSIT